MPAPRQPPQTIGQLMLAGLLDQAASLVAGLLAPGTDVLGSEALQDVLNQLLPPLLPSTYLAAQRRVSQAVEAIWASTPAGQPQPVDVSAIPLEDDRTGAAGYYTERILYRVLIDAPSTSGDTVSRTVYVPSQVPLDYSAIVQESQSILAVALALSPDRYEEIAPESQSDWTFTIQEITRGY